MAAPYFSFTYIGQLYREERESCRYVGLLDLSPPRYRANGSIIITFTDTRTPLYSQWHMNTNTNTHTQMCFPGKNPWEVHLHRHSCRSTLTATLTSTLILTPTDIHTKTYLHSIWPSHSHLHLEELHKKTPWRIFQRKHSREAEKNLYMSFPGKHPRETSWSILGKAWWGYSGGASHGSTPKWSFMKLL